MRVECGYGNFVLNNVEFRAQVVLLSPREVCGRNFWVQTIWCCCWWNKGESSGTHIAMKTMERPPRSNRISKRVLGNWERLVYAAQLRADEGTTSLYHEDYRRNTAESSGSSQAVPQSLSDQANIEAILQAADEVDDVQVARLCASSSLTFLHLFFFLSIYVLAVKKVQWALPPNICNGSKSWSAQSSIRTEYIHHLAAAVSRMNNT